MTSVKDHSQNESKQNPLPPLHGIFSSGLILLRKKEIFYLMTHSTHFIYGYIASDIW